MNQIINDLKKENARLNYILSQNGNKEDLAKIKEKIEQLEDEKKKLQEFFDEFSNNKKEPEEIHDNYRHVYCLWNFNKNPKICGKEFHKIPDGPSVIGYDNYSKFIVNGEE